MFVFLKEMNFAPEKYIENKYSGYDKVFTHADTFYVLHSCCDAARSI